MWCISSSKVLDYRDAKENPISKEAIGKYLRRSGWQSEREIKRANDVVPATIIWFSIYVFVRSRPFGGVVGDARCQRQTVEPKVAPDDFRHLDLKPSPLMIRAVSLALGRTLVYELIAQGKLKSIAVGRQQAHPR